MISSPCDFAIVVSANFSALGLNISYCIKVFVEDSAAFFYKQKACDWRENHTRLSVKILLVWIWHKATARASAASSGRGIELSPKIDFTIY